MDDTPLFWKSRCLLKVGDYSNWPHVAHCEPPTMMDNPLAEPSERL